MADGGSVHRYRWSLVVDDDGLFISRPAIGKIIEDNRPIQRRFDFWAGWLLPQREMAEDVFDDV